LKSTNAEDISSTGESSAGNTEDQQVRHTTSGGSR
jgi:hypothetical protein